MSEETDALVALAGMENARVIHYQQERAKTTHIIFVLAGAIIALICFDKLIFGTVDKTLASILIALGLLGMFLNVKYHDRIHFHESRQSLYNDEIDTHLPNAKIGLVRTNAKQKFEQGNLFKKIIYYSTLYMSWILVNAFPVAIGITLLVLASGKKCP